MTKPPILSLLLFLLIALMMTLSGCMELPSPGQTPTAGSGSTTADLDTWFQLYFTDPTSPTAKSYRGGPDAKLANAIDEARLSVDAETQWGVAAEQQ